MRVVSYNVHRGQDDRMALLRVVRALDPDLLCVQEAPSWWGSERKRDLLGLQTQMRYVAGSARNAVFAAPGVSVVACRRRRIKRPVLRRRNWWLVPQLPGGAVLVTARTRDEQAYTVTVCHLGLATDARVDELGQVLAMGRPDLIVGDVNEPPGGAVWEAVSSTGMTVLHDQPTFTAASPATCIDLVAADPQLSATVADHAGFDRLNLADLAEASDHLPIVIDLGTPATPVARRQTRTGWPTAMPSAPRGN